MTGPKSLLSSLGSPACIEAIAPESMVSTLSAMSCCKNSTRKAEQRAKDAADAGKEAEE